MTVEALDRVSVEGERTESSEDVLTPDALSFVAALQREFNSRRVALVARRRERHEELQDGGGGTLGFLAATRSIRESEWRVAPTPPDLLDRRVEITGPADRKMMINALNSGANAFMVDFEDSLSPTWTNVVEGQANLRDAVRRTLKLVTREKRYELAPAVATLLVRPRGWHLTERHVTVDGAAVSASLFDFGLAFFHNARTQLTRGTGPYFYLPKLQSHLEARLWNDVFVFAQESLGIPRGCIRATVLIETIHAAFEMDEILFELREHASGLNAGRWDYLFSIIKTFRDRRGFVLPDRAQLTMAVPFMRSYAQLLVRTCHRRGALAIGGMAAYIPSRKDAAANEVALSKVRADKVREVNDGFDGTWVAHPDLVPIAKSEFDRVLGDKPNQVHRLRDDVAAGADELTDFRVDGGRVTRQGMETNIDVGLRYLVSWLRGQGAAAIHNLMEDAATAEISRCQLWQWVRHQARLDGDGTATAKEYLDSRDRIVARVRGDLEPGDGVGDGTGSLDKAVSLLDRLVLGEFEDFLTLRGYELLR